MAAIAPLWFQWSVFPVLLGGAVGGAMLIFAPETSPAVAILGPQLTAIFLVAILEHVYPYHRSWNRTRRDVRVDATHTLVIAASVGVVTPLVVVAGGWLSRAIGSGLWPDHWPMLAQLVIALVIGELPGYWVHRWQHQHEWLWRFHATHHSAPRLYWLNAGRFHPIDTLSVFIPSFVLLIALGCGEAVLALFLLVTTVHGIFQHANLQLRLGPLNHYFSMAELHRWHHSKTVEEANHNFGQTIIVWDTLFGTRFHPQDREPPEEIGIPGLPSFPMTWLAQIISPFRWSNIKRESEGQTSQTA